MKNEKLNILDVITTESCYEEINKDILELNGISTEIGSLTNKESELLTVMSDNEKLKDYIENEGYEVTIESARSDGETLWEKIKKAIQWLVEKFLIIWDKVRLKLTAIFSNNEKVIKSLKAYMDRNKTLTTNNVDTTGFSFRFPIIKKFDDIDDHIEILKVFKDIGEKIIYNLDSNFLLKDGIKSIPDDYYSIFKGGIPVSCVDGKLVSFNTSKNGRFVYETYNYTTQKPEPTNCFKYEEIMKLIDAMLNFNKFVVRSFGITKDITKNLKKLEPANDTDSDPYSSKNIQYNVNIALTIIKDYSLGLNSITKNMIFITSQHLRCYSR